MKEETAMKMKNCQRKSILSSNKGFSLVELMVVIAIMAVATGLVTITYSLVHNANVSKAANALDTAFNKARVQSMAKGPDAGQLTLWIAADGILYYTIGDPSTETPTAVNTGTTEVRYGQVGAGSTYGSMEPKTYRFNSAGMVLPSTEGTLPDYFQFFYGNRRVDVIFYLDTGKHTTVLR